MTEQAVRAIERLIWDYRISVEAFTAMLDGEIKPGGWAAPHRPGLARIETNRKESNARPGN